jgi:hypothetical protein
VLLALIQSIQVKAGHGRDRMSLVVLEQLPGEPQGGLHILHGARPSHADVRQSVLG